MSAPTREELFAVVVKALEDLFEVDASGVTTATNLFVDLDLDSLDAIDLAATLSKKAHIKLSAEEMKKIRTVGDIVEIGVQKLGPSA